MHNIDDAHTRRADSIEDEIFTNREASDAWPGIVTFASSAGILRKHPKMVQKLQKKIVGVLLAIGGNVAPDFEKLTSRTPA